MRQEMPLTAPKRCRTRLSRLWGIKFSSKIIAEVKQTRMFSVMADEAADISNKENMSLVLRYVDSSKNIREQFVGFRLCGEETTGNAIKESIINSVHDLGLTMDNCRGQSYGGAGNMASRYVGASTLIQHQFPKAIYVHCMNHSLNLCVADTCSLAMVQNMMGTVEKLSEFFSNSPKRQNHFVDKIKELLPNSNHRILVDVCRTRWIACISGLDRIVELLVPVLSTLENVKLNMDKNGVVRAGTLNPKSRDNAQSLLNAFTFGFIVTLVIVQYILNLTRPLLSCKVKKWTFLRLSRKLSLYRMPLKTCRQTSRVIIIVCLKRQYNFHRKVVFNLADQEFSSAKFFVATVLPQFQKHTIRSTLRKCFWAIACSNFNQDFLQNPMCVLKVFLLYYLFC